MYALAQPELVSSPLLTPPSDLCMESLFAEQQQLRRRVSELSGAFSKLLTSSDSRDSDITRVLRSLQADVARVDSTTMSLTQGLDSVNQRSTALDPAASGLEGRVTVMERATAAVLGLDARCGAREALNLAVGDQASLDSFVQQLPRPQPSSRGLQGVRERLLSIRSSLAKPSEPWPPAVPPLPFSSGRNASVDGFSTHKVLAPHSVRVIPPQDNKAELQTFFEEKMARLQAHVDAQLADQRDAYSKLGSTLLSEVQASTEFRTKAMNMKATEVMESAAGVDEHLRQDGNEEMASQLDEALAQLRSTTTQQSVSRLRSSPSQQSISKASGAKTKEPSRPLHDPSPGHAVRRVNRSKANKEDCFPAVVEASKSSMATSPQRLHSSAPTPARSDRARAALSSLWPGGLNTTTGGM